MKVQMPTYGRILIVALLAEFYAFLITHPGFSFLLNDTYLSYGSSNAWLFVEMPFFVGTKYLTAYLVAAIVFAPISPLASHERNTVAFLELFFFEFAASLFAGVLVWLKRVDMVGVIYFVPLVQYLLQAGYADGKTTVQLRSVPLTGAMFFVCIILGDRLHFVIYDYYANLF